MIWISRDPRDVLVSAWHHARFREQVTEAELSDFVRNPRTGIEKLMTAITRWKESEYKAASTLHLTYEDMHKNPHDALRNTLLFINVNNINENILDLSVKECEFNVMKEREESNFYKTARMTTPSTDIRARKVRSGKVGSFRDYLSEADLKFIDDAIESHVPSGEKRTGLFGC